VVDRERPSGLRAFVVNEIKSKVIDCRTHSHTDDMSVCQSLLLKIIVLGVVENNLCSLEVRTWYDEPA
jgi:hypothetical protein